MNKTEIVSILLILVIIIVGLQCTWLLQTHRPFTETVILQKQYIGNFTDGVAGNCVDCLVMDVSHHGYNKTYYFAGEHTVREDLVEGYEIKVMWKYIFFNGDYRIRKIYQPTPKDGFRVTNHNV